MKVVSQYCRATALAPKSPAEGVRLLEAVGHKYGHTFHFQEAPVAASPSTLTASHCRRSRCGWPRTAMRSYSAQSEAQVGRPAGQGAPGRRHPGHPQGAGPVRQPPARAGLSGAHRRQPSQTLRPPGRGLRRRPGADRRTLLRQAQAPLGDRDGAPQGRRYHGLYGGADSPRPPRGLPSSRWAGARSSPPWTRPTSWRARGCGGSWRWR